MKEESTLVRMSFSIEEELLSDLEQLMAHNGYQNRSEFIRDMIRKQLTRKHCAADGEVIGTISVLCDLNFAGIESKVIGITDQATAKVLGSTRFALADHCSTFMITAVGQGGNIRELTNAYRKLKGVIQAEFVITSSAGGTTKD